MSHVVVRGARSHNLRNVDVDVPKHKLVAITGVSGSGKSSFVSSVADESQRQLLNTFTSFQRSRMGTPSRPDVDVLENLGTPVIINQKPLGGNVRSNVLTASDMSAPLRMLFSRFGSPSIGYSHLFSFNDAEGMCKQCSGTGSELDVDTASILDMDKSLAQGAVKHPDFAVDGWYYKSLIGARIFDMDAPVKTYSPELLEKLLHAPRTKIPEAGGDAAVSRNCSWEGIVSSLKRRRVLTESRGGLGNRADPGGKVDADAADGGSAPPPLGFVMRQCTECRGGRLSAKARGVKLGGKSIVDVCDMEIRQLVAWLDTVGAAKGETKEARESRAGLVAKLRKRAQCLTDLGAGYLSLSRPTATLSGGESQRVKLSAALGCLLVDLVYFLDEPSSGMHPKDITGLIGTLRGIRDAGNTVLVITHAPQIIAGADHVIEFGPAAGSFGGQLIFSGTPDAQLDCEKSVTGTHRRRLRDGGDDEGTRATKRARRTAPVTDFFAVRGVSKFNLDNVDVDVPLKALCCITGVSGSGKSTLLRAGIRPALEQAGHKIIVVDQASIGRSSRSTPATFVGLMDDLRDIFSAATGQPRSRFTFNSKTGCCQTCKGLGIVYVEMAYMEPSATECAACQGKRYSKEMLKHTFAERNIGAVLDMSVDTALTFFSGQASEHEDQVKLTKSLKKLIGHLRVLADVGLGYLSLGRPTSTLSGGECQRLKLASELGKRGAIFILDEPTAGLHLSDVATLMRLLRMLVDKGNTVITVDHNIAGFASFVDHIIDLGPGAGAAGGRVCCTGPPSAIRNSSESITAKFISSS